MCLEPFFPLIDIQQALVQHTQCPCRFVILATKALQSQASRQTYVYTSRIQDTRYIQTYAVYSCVWRLWVVSLEHGGGALGIFKSPVWTYNQAWTFSLPSSHYFSFLSKRSGRRMPPAERSEKTCLDLAHFGGHARHILPPFSPSQPVIADEEII